MEYVRIPGTTLSPSRIGLGTWAIGGCMWGGTDEERSIQTICAALDRGRMRGNPEARRDVEAWVSNLARWLLPDPSGSFSGTTSGHTRASGGTRYRITAQVLGQPVSCLQSRTDSQAGHRRFDPGAFGRKFLANADLPERFRLRATLNVDDQFTYYGGGAKGHRLPESRPGTGRATETLRGRQVAIML